MNTCVALAEMDRTAAFAPPVNVVISAPVVALSTANRLRAAPLMLLNSPPT
jgi:hypothetical protein